MTKGQLTSEGRIVGTVAYMSPEQAQGKAVDARSDVFSLGVLLFEMATGEKPFKGDTNMSLLSAIIKDTPSSVTDLRQDLPRDVGRILRRCLAKDPEERYQTAKDLRNDLRLLKEDLDTGVTERAQTAPVSRAGVAARARAPARGWHRASWPAIAEGGGTPAPRSDAAPAFANITAPPHEHGDRDPRAAIPDGRYVVTSTAVPSPASDAGVHGRSVQIVPPMTGDYLGLARRTAKPCCKFSPRTSR
jgi:hypothetical protein